MSSNDDPRMSIAENHQRNGLARIRTTFAHPYVVMPGGWGTEEATVVNIETVSSKTLVVDLSDGTSIRVDVKRYLR